MSADLWYVNLVGRAPVPAVWVGAGWVAVSWAVTALLGFDFGDARLEARVPYALCATIGYLIAATPYSSRKTQENLDSLRPLWKGEEEDFQAVRESFARLPPRTAAAAIAAALPTALVIQQSVFGRLSRLFDSGWTVLDGWMMVLGVLLWTLLIPAACLAVRTALTLRRIGRDRIVVALWDVTRATPLARFGLRAILIWIVGPLAFIAVSLAARATVAPIAFALWLVNAMAAVFCLIVPVSGLRTQIRQRKDAELERIARALSGKPGAMQDSELGDEARTLDRLQLLQWRRELEATREWAFDAPVLRRFALFVALPLLSWVAAALVERSLDVVFGR